MAIVGDHPKAKSDGDQERSEAVEVKGVRRPPARRRERGFDAEPSDQDDGKRTKEVTAHGLEHAGMLGHELRQKREEIVHRTGRHRFSKGVGLLSAGVAPVRYGMLQASMAALAPCA